MALLSDILPFGLRRAARCLLAAASLASAVAAPLAAPDEYQLKAVFLFNFAQFVEWPAAAFATPKSPIVIGVLGEDPFGAHLDEVVRGEIINGRPVAVRRFARPAEVDECHILFISHSESRQLGAVLEALRGRTILTVGDTEGYALRGVMIRFTNDKNRVRLRINLEAARAAGLVISSKLLRPAEIVTTRED